VDRTRAVPDLRSALAVSKSWAVLFFLLLSGFFLSSCVTLHDPEASSEYTADVVATLEQGKPVVQSFFSRRPGLNGVQLWLRVVGSSQQPVAGQNEILVFSLYHTPEEAFQTEHAALATVTIPYQQIKHTFPLTITFPPLEDGSDQTYALRLEAQGAPVAVYGRLEDAYPDGALYLDGKAASAQPPADLGFRTSYEYGLRALTADLLNGLQGAWLVIPLLLLLWIPGRLALKFLWPRDEQSLINPAKRMDWGEQAGLTVGLSMAITPLILLWTTTLGLRWSVWAVWVGLGLAAAVLVYDKYRSTKKQEGSSGRVAYRPDWIDFTLVVLFGLALWLRLAMVRDLASPAWVDPVHHTTIARLIIEHGAYPPSYAPYVEASTASYHPGFHGLVAAFQALSGLELDRAMLLFGQVLNALILPAVYLLGLTLTRSRAAGLMAALIAGFLTPMPTYYTSWGRYTQLAGLLVLPVCTSLMIRLLDAPLDLRKLFKQGSLLRLAVLSALTSAGLFLVHYRVAGFWALLMLAYFISEVLRTLDKQPLWVSIPRLVGWTLVVATLALLISLPWWPDLIQSMLAPRLERVSPPPQPLTIDWGYLLPAYGREALWLAAAGLLISIFRLGWFGPMLALWVGLLFMAANQGTIPIPGAGMINRSSVEIMLFMPIAVLGGYVAAQMVELLSWGMEKFIPRWGKRGIALLAAIAILAAALAGSQKLLPILNPVTLTFREADHPAMEWISKNIPPEETILINPFLWGYGYYAGQDGGYWISPLAGRKTMPPNLLYAEGSREYIERVNRISQKTLDLANDPGALHALLAEEQIRYVYIGRRGGALSPQKLSASGLFDVIYNQAGVWIFQMR